MRKYREWYVYHACHSVGCINDSRQLNSWVCSPAVRNSEGSYNRKSLYLFWFVGIKKFRKLRAEPINDDLPSHHSSHIGRGDNRVDLLNRRKAHCSIRDKDCKSAVTLW